MQFHSKYNSLDFCWNQITIKRTQFLVESNVVHQFFTIHPTRRTSFSNLLWNETLHVSESSSVHHQEFLTVHTTMVYFSLQAVNKPVWHIPLLCVQWKTSDDGRRNCPKHVDFHSKLNLRN